MAVILPSKWKDFICKINMEKKLRSILNISKPLKENEETNIPLIFVFHYNIKVFAPKYTKMY